MREINGTVFGACADINDHNFNPYMYVELTYHLHMRYKIL
jgi:hypothetical protein